jgi:TonB family protein
MTKRLLSFLCVVLLCAFVSHAQQRGEAPFASLEKEVKNRGRWSGDKSTLSAVFDAERRRLGDRFESELLKWLGNDPERHYWISCFLRCESYLHGNKPLPQLSLLIKQQGLVLLAGKVDQESQGWVVGLSITAAIVSDELGLQALARAYKTDAETLLRRDPDLLGYIPAVSAVERQRYDMIKATVSRKSTAEIDLNDPQPAARVSGGVLNGKALNNVKPEYPAAARAAKTSGMVYVRVVFDESGTVIWAKAVGGPAELRKAAENAARQTKFSPMRVSGQLEKVSGILVYDFEP